MIFPCYSSLHTLFSGGLWNIARNCSPTWLGGAIVRAFVVAGHSNVIGSSSIGRISCDPLFFTLPTALSTGQIFRTSSGDRRRAAGDARGEPDQVLKVWPVDKKVGNVRNKGAELALPVQ